MARSDDVTVALADLDEATNALGERVQSLIDQINRTPGDGLNGTQTEAVLAQLASVKSVLDQMGHAPNPLPEVNPNAFKPVV